MHEQNYASYGFSKVEDNAHKLMTRVVAILLKNVVTNAMYITQACGCKTVKGAHLEAVQNVLKYYLNKRKSGKSSSRRKTTSSKKSTSSKKQAGGHAGYVLPSEYFNPIQSGAYFNEVTSTSPIEAANVVGGELTRGALDATFVPELTGGAARVAFVDAALLKKMLKDMKLPVRVSKEAIDIMVASVNATMDTIMNNARRFAGNNNSTLTASVFARASKQVRHVKAAL